MTVAEIVESHGSAVGGQDCDTLPWFDATYWYSLCDGFTCSKHQLLVIATC